MSLNGPKVRLIKRNEEFGVCYYTQKAIDAEVLLIVSFDVTKNPTDYGLITQISFDVKKDYCANIFDSLEGKDYEELGDIT